MRALRDRYGFLFWLKWILWFAGSLVLSAIYWTKIMQRIFGRIEGVELTITWIVSVFGSWLILVIPFMRKKEQIWKRLNDDQEKAVDAWLFGMGIFIGLLVVSLFFWSFVFRERISSHGASLDPSWTKAVFGTWLFLLIPFLIWMYRAADTIFKNAVGRQTHVPSFKSVSVDSSKRLLPFHLSEKLKKEPVMLPNGHVVTVILKNGNRIPHVFVLNAKEILGVYDKDALDFSIDEIADLEALDKDHLPLYEESRWLRLDGVI